MSYRNILKATVIAVGAWAVSAMPAAATPHFAQGSFALTFETNTTTNLDTAFTVFHMTGGSLGCLALNASSPCFDIGTKAGDFNATVQPGLLTPFIFKVNSTVSGNSFNLDFSDPNSFDFAESDGINFGGTHGYGDFDATSTTFVGHTGLSPNSAVKWNVQGNFTVGSQYDNAGQVLTAIETWTINQTGGPGQAIQIGGTFFSPATTLVPEPASLALLGAGLLGAGAFGRRRKAKKA